MTKKLFYAALICVIALCNSCKNDSEDDVKPPVSDLSGLFINEIYSSNPDWIELYNSSNAAIDISGFILQDDKGATEEYKIPEGTVIASKSYLVLGLAYQTATKLFCLTKTERRLIKPLFP